MTPDLMSGRTPSASVPLAMPLLRVEGRSHRYPGPQGREDDARWALHDACFTLDEGEVLAIVGESGSGKSTLLRAIAGQLPPGEGTVQYRDAEGRWCEVGALPERERRRLARTEWGYIAQDAREGLRMGVSAGANIAERLMSLGERRYAVLRATAQTWMRQVELDPARVDETPAGYSGGMRQRLQIARHLVTRPRLVLMDEPTSGLDVSVQARLLDLLRDLVARLGLSVIIVTHDLGVARLLAHRTLVMRGGRIVEQGLTDRVFDDPRHPYTQLLVSSVLTP